jgi:CHAT domain-containing protein/Tfp pilus assembly protein PilF
MMRISDRSSLALLGGQRFHFWAVFVSVLACSLSASAEEKPRGTVLTGHRRAINCLSFQSRLLASAGADEVIKLWDFQAGKEERTLRGASPFLAVAMNPAYTILAAGDTEVISVWNVQDGKLLGALRGHKGPIRSLAFSLDGKTLASAGDDSTVRLFSMRGKELALLKGHTGRVNAVALSWDGKYVASAGDDGLVKIWDMATHECTVMLRGHEGPVLSIAYAFHNRQLASGGLDRTVRLWDVPEGKPSRTLHGHRGGVYSLAYSLDGRSLLSGGADRTVWLWDHLVGKAWDIFAGFKDSVGSVAVSIDKQTLAVGTLDGSLELRRLQPLPQFSLPAVAELADAQKRGTSLEKTGKWPEAVEHYRKYAALARQTTGPLSQFNAIFTDSLGQALVMVDHAAQGAAEMQRSIDIWEELGREDVVAPSAIVLGVYYRDLGELTKSATLLERALELRVKQFGPGDLKTASAQYALAMTYYQQGRFTEAKSLLEKSLETRERKLGFEDRQVALSASGLGAVYAAIGQPDAACSFYGRGIRILIKGNGRDVVNACTLLNNMALLYAGLGQFEQAEDQLKRCLELAKKAFGPDDIRIVNYLNSLATVYSCTKQYAKAEALLNQSIRIIEKAYGPEHLALSVALPNLAALDMATGKPAEAEKLLERALAIKQSKVGPEHPDVAMLLYSLCGTELRLGNWTKADSLLSRALAISKARLPADHPLTMRCLVDHAVLLGVEGRWNDAIVSADEARHAALRYETSALSMLSEKEQLRFLNSDGEFGIQWYQTLSMAALRPNDQKLVDKSAAWVLNGKAITHEVLSERSLLLREVFSKGVNLRPLRVLELQQIREQLAAAQFASSAQADESQRRAQIEKLRKHEMELTIYFGLNDDSEKRAAPWVELSAVRETMGDAALIEIVKLRPYSFRKQDLAGDPWRQPRYVAWIIPPAGKGNVRFIDLGDAAAIEAAVAAAREALQTPPGPDEAAGEKRSREPIAALSRLVLDPLLAAAGSVQRWIVSPDGDLWLVPWSALTFTDGSYAIERLQIHYVVSGRQLVKRKEAERSAGAVVIADPDYDLTVAESAAEGGSRVSAGEIALNAKTRSGDIRAAHWARLPGTAAEAREILPQLAALVSAKPRLYLDKEALETEFKLLERPQILVLSTHGFFLEDQHVETVAALKSPVASRPKATSESGRGLDFESDMPTPTIVRQSGKNIEGLENPLLRCGLVLAGANRREGEIRADDGILTGLEIIATDLRGTELVVLSACETGLGQVHNGEGVAGLRQAFQIAGARAVASTLWRIPDEETARLMQLFFTELRKNNGTDKAAALREAQLTVIREHREKKGAAHPYYWAAFTLTGS